MKAQVKEVSLSEVHESIDVSKSQKGWRRLLAYMGPAYLVSVGYMDPGNWATDLAGGAQFGYALIWVLLMSNLMALLLQGLSARLGIVRRRDLAQANRETYPRFVNFALYLLADVLLHGGGLESLRNIYARVSDFSHQRMVDLAATCASSGSPMAHAPVRLSSASTAAPRSTSRTAE